MQRKLVYPFRSHKAPRLAMVLVDLQESCRDRMAYEGGSVALGLSRVTETIRAVREGNWPLCIVNYECSPEPLHEIAHAAGEGAPRFLKRMQSAFTSEEFLGFVRENQIDTFLVAGWVRSICVRDTMLDIVWGGQSLIYSDELLFHREGYPARDALMPHERLFFGPYVDYHDCAATLIRAISELRLRGPSG